MSSAEDFRVPASPPQRAFTFELMPTDLAAIDGLGYPQPEPQAT